MASSSTPVFYPIPRLVLRDLHLTWPLLVTLYALVPVFAQRLSAFLSSQASGLRPTPTSMELLTSALPILVAAAAAWIVLLDPPEGRRAAEWRTRPIDPRRLVATKLAVLAFFVVLPVAALEWRLLATFARPSTHLGPVVLELALRVALVAFGSALVASLFDRLSPFLVFGIPALWIWLIGPLAHSPSSDPRQDIVVGSPAFVTAALAMIGVAVWGLGARYRGRDWRHVVLRSAVAMLLVSALAALLPDDRQVSLPTAARLAAPDLALTVDVLEPGPPATACPQRRAATICANLEISLPPGFVATWMPDWMGSTPEFSSLGPEVRLVTAAGASELTPIRGLTRDTDRYRHQPRMRLDGSFIGLSRPELDAWRQSGGYFEVVAQPLSIWSETTVARAPARAALGPIRARGSFLFWARLFPSEHTPGFQAETMEVAPPVPGSELLHRRIAVDLRREGERRTTTYESGGGVSHLRLPLLPEGLRIYRRSLAPQTAWRDVGPITAEHELVATVVERVAGPSRLVGRTADLHPDDPRLFVRGGG